MAAIVFDLDGTLIHSAPDIHHAANSLLAEHGKGPLSLETVTGFIGKGVPWLVTCLIRETGLDPALHPELVAGFGARYESAVTLTRPYPGVVAALETLKDAGHRMAVCTNKPVAPALAVLEHLNLAGFFDHVQGGDMLGVKKPDPAPVRATLAALEVPTAIYVGDSETDAETAQRAGLPFALFLGGYRKTPPEELPHEFAFADFAELAPFIRAHSAPGTGSEPVTSSRS